MTNFSNLKKAAVVFGVLFSMGSSVSALADDAAVTYASQDGKGIEKGLPNPSLGSPNAYGGAGTLIFGSVGYESHWNNGTDADGSAGLGISFGDPRKYVGALVSINNDTLGLNGESFGANGSFGLRLNRYVAENTAVAVGAMNFPGWGAFANTSQNYYFALTQGIKTWLPITLNAGVGTGDFSTTGVGETVSTDNNIGAFAGIGLEVYKNLSLITDWAREEMNVGASYGFLVAKLPVFLSAGAMNVTEAHGASYHWQFGAAIAYSLSA